MPSLDKALLLSAMCPPLDETLSGQLLDEFVSQEKRYVLGDWEPAELDGGQFAEAAARILYHQDSGNLSRTKSVDRCLRYVEDPNNSNTHSYPERKSSLHITRVLRTVYKFRSDRGAVHISPDYTANHLDSRLIIECVRWVVSELFRIFWQRDRSLVAQAIREIIQYDIPVIGNYEGHLIVQRTDCLAEEEVLILLHHAGESGLSRKELGRYVQKNATSVTRAIAKLLGSHCRQIIRLSNGNYRLTELGTRRVISDLGDKLVL